jgi:uncharacterized ion transporter superfamily protein YfcC
MNNLRIFSLALCLAALTYSVAPAAAAQDRQSAAAMSDEEDRTLAARAVETPQLENFQGGNALVIGLAVIGVVALLYGVWYLWMIAHMHC